eukprot:jgi/Chrzof1/12171/Cz06g23210.t1
MQTPVNYGYFSLPTAKPAAATGCRVSSAAPPATDGSLASAWLAGDVVFLPLLSPALHPEGLHFHALGSSRQAVVGTPSDDDVGECEHITHYLPLPSLDCIASLGSGSKSAKGDDSMTSCSHKDQTSMHQACYHVVFKEGCGADESTQAPHYAITTQCQVWDDEHTTLAAESTVNNRCQHPTQCGDSSMSTGEYDNLLAVRSFCEESGGVPEDDTYMGHF